MTVDIDQFLKTGYGFVDLDPASLPLGETLSDLERFIALPKEQKLRFHMPQPDHNLPDPGYTLKEGGFQPENGWHADFKEWMHFAPNILRRLTTRKEDPLNDEDLKAWLTWFQNMSKIYLACKDQMDQIILAIEERTGRVLPIAAKEYPSLLRVMAYDAGKPGKEHTDKSLITFHVATTHPGYLMRGTPVESPSDQMLVFGGKKLARWLDRPDLAVPHEAKAIQGVEGERRMVIVFFGHIDGRFLREMKFAC